MREKPVEHVAYMVPSVRNLFHYFTRGERSPDGIRLDEGMRDTPQRFLESWREELLSGYDVTPEQIKKMLTEFDGATYDGIVLLRDIEIYSLCEHHALPFFGVAHVAYIPGSNRVVGLSKLARLVDIYARRFQMQERIGVQVCDALEEHLKPAACACLIEAKHLCVAARGIRKQHSVMQTSSMRGKFLEGGDARQELLQMVFAGR